MTDTALAPNATLRQADGLFTASLGEELLMMSISQNKYFNLNEIGTVIWQLLEQPRTIEQLIDALTAQFDVSRETAQAELTTFIAALRERELIAVD